MRPLDRSARRYHWLGTRVTDMVREPHAAIASQRSGQRVLDLTASDSDRARNAATELARQEPDRVARELDRLTVLAMPHDHAVDVSTRDPARFSFAHGGKDGHPFPVDRETYDRSIDYLKAAVSRARVGRADRVDALKRLSGWTAGGS